MRIFIYCRRYVKWKSDSFLIKVKILLPCELMTVPLVFTQRLWQLYTQTHTWIFSEVLFILITAHTWKQPTYPLIIEWRNKTVLYPEHVILFSSKEKWGIKPQEDFEESKMYIIKWKKSVWKANEHILDDYNYTISEVQYLSVVGRKEWIGRVQAIFKAAKILCMILYWCLHNKIHLPKPT